MNWLVYYCFTTIIKCGSLKMFKDQNLLNISARDPPDYARKILRTLFTCDELSTSVLPSRYDHLYVKKPLDKERFDLLNSKFE